MKYFNKTTIALAITLASSQAAASGFQSNSQSATGFGRAFAGDAIIADNASVLSRNPAAMALFKDTAISAGVSYIDIDISVKDVSLVGGMPSYGSVNSAGTNKFIPNFYYIQPINDKFAFGVAAFTNFATGTDAGALANNFVQHPKTKAPIPAPVDLLGETEVTTMNFNTSVSYRINEQLSLGAGIDFVYGEGKVTRNSKLTGKLADIDADGWAIGGIIGLAYEVDADNRFGISYRFSPEFKAQGDINKVVGFKNEQKDWKEYVSFNDIVIPLPDIFQVAGFHQLNDKFAIHYTAQLTTWGDFDAITLENGKGQTQSVANEEFKSYLWKDSWLFSIGGTYTITENFTARMGVMVDEAVAGPISSVSIPDSNRTWYTTGFSYSLDTSTTLDFGIAVVRGEDTEVIEHSAIYPTPNPSEKVPNISAHTRSDAIYYSMQYNYQF